MYFCALTDKGAVRKQNQDSFYTFCDAGNELAVLLVCDGMGGAKAGNVASDLASKIFAEEMKRTVAPGISAEDAERALRNAVRVANSAVYQLSISLPDCRGMGTTMVAAVISGTTAVFVNVGDSRAYHIKKDRITQITHDHSIVADMVARGDLTEEESRRHPNRNLITRALGTGPEVKCDTFTVDVEKDDHILLCTDGLSNLVAEEEIVFRTGHSDSLENCCSDLMKLALARGGFDNITVVMLRK